MGKRASASLTYKGADIFVDRDKRSANWYIQVRMEDGTFGYDGWWPDSADKTALEAIEEAKAGAWLDKETP